ncbi:hypothetical protein FXF50_04880 [Micromonospora sp. AP08]|uniref:protein kinase domain-containing protein n=1 Tax=Micromonospora sp. AP08 TaxID=2604467 RepID=UPI0011D3667E|nr:hypothetical protein [Micromonospora sp. AP08]TYB39715.1 hypothetical protein FXF50_04880 [Micromonospora sp. AP08]
MLTPPHQSRDSRATMRSDATVVTDDAGVNFTLGPLIAKGGQGAVYRVEGYPEVAIKLLERPEDLERIRSVRRLPLDGLPVAAPVTLIQGRRSGYTMRLASDMQPLREPYLPSDFGPRETTPRWYSETGGLRRRLAIAANTADVIAKLHGLGLTYVDLNPNNVMVSDDLTRDVTWLIDCDNLTSMSKPKWDVLGFRGYAAPERKRKAPPSTLADAYILGVHVFRMLVLRHPLEGVLADALDGNEARERMDRGDLPYVADRDDDSNRLARGTFAWGIFDLVLSKQVQKLCRQTFSEGRLDPTKRPGSARWREVLFAALNNVIDCPASCGWSYFRTLKACPSCGTQTGAVALLSVYGGDFEQPLSERDTFVVSQSSDTAVLPRHLWGRFDQHDAVVTLQPTSRGLEVKPQHDVTLTDKSGKVTQRLRLPAAGRVVRLKLEAPGRPARMLALRTMAAS